MRRGALFAACVALWLTVAARPGIADVAIDPWRNRESGAAWQCPQRIVNAAGRMSARAGAVGPVRMELIDGRAGTLDLDVIAGGQPRPAFRLRFPPQRLASQFMLALFMNDGSSRSACVVQLPPRARAFDVEFPLTAFRQALGMPDYSDVDYILLVTGAAPGPGADARAAAKVLSISVSGIRQPGALLARCR